MITRKPLILLLALACTSWANAQPNVVPVFISGKDGYGSYRIPAIINAPNGDLLAFCEGRVHHAGDFGDIDIVLKRSTDNGKTWSSMLKVVDYDTLQAGNPAPVVDLLDPAYPEGRIFLFYNTGNNHEGEVRKGLGLREVWFVTSTDGGRTWSEAVNITAQVHRPNQPNANWAYQFTEDWRSYANTPGHGMQFDHGIFKGRIYIAANHSSGAPQKAFKDYHAHGYYTDDHGKTFHLSEAVPFKGSNESMAALIQGDTLLMNSRNQQGNVRSRIISLSSDGGATWDTTYYDRQLPDPVNQGSLLAFDDEDGKRLLAFCNAADTAHRDNLTLRMSRDGGKTWFFNRPIAKAPASYEGAYAAYSDLVKIDNKRIGVLFEKDGYRQIVFTSVPWHE
ncbi:sialidase family protein [Parapedobacter sp. 10938]|uniref:sialidase family protein n=1 Tax=Parapedobacter flavus TaxID=3110225 RepID=UPI002DB5EDEA|nr:sialidase family protein [Parapedobacter sp. 10938]MEC3880725.1 sialidase family protein [Parapedobacter sp. 10938]